MKKLFLVISILFTAASFAQEDNQFRLNNLLQAGTISVTIGGDFVMTGSFPALLLKG
jgi:hypothetical protein